MNMFGGELIYASNYSSDMWCLGGLTIHNYDYCIIKLVTPLLSFHIITTLTYFSEIDWYINKIYYMVKCQC